MNQYLAGTPGACVIVGRLCCFSTLIIRKKCVFLNEWGACNRSSVSSNCQASIRVADNARDPATRQVEQDHIESVESMFI